MSFVEELTWRGLVQQSTDPELAAKMRAEPFTLYIGFDPTSDSLHVGSLLPLLTLVRAQRAGHKPIGLVGGATGMIGDPSGKTEERKLMPLEVLRHNVGALGAQISRLAPGTLMVDNHEWFQGYGYLDFLRDIGKHFSVNMMLAKESVRARLEDREHGISYTEFSYMLIQAYDFLSLYDRHGCTLQIGGSDQWGNITAGIDLVRRLRAKEVYGLTMPLVTNASGQKFGKSEKGNIWLDANKTSPYDFYQFFFRVDDRDVGRFLRYFTFLDEQTILGLEAEVQKAPEKREAQRTLAREVTKCVHGEVALAQSETELPSTAMALPKPLVDVLVECGLCKSKSDARRQIEQGGVYVDGARIDDVAYVLASGATLQRGKRDKHVITGQ
jgi:tyrosyl-tRNA synthetase